MKGQVSTKTKKWKDEIQKCENAYNYTKVI